MKQALDAARESYRPAIKELEAKRNAGGYVFGDDESKELKWLRCDQNKAKGAQLAFAIKHQVILDEKEGIDQMNKYLVAKSKDL